LQWTEGPRTSAPVTVTPLPGANGSCGPPLSRGLKDCSVPRSVAPAAGCVSPSGPTSLAPVTGPADCGVPIGLRRPWFEANDGNQLRLAGGAAFASPMQGVSGGSFPSAHVIPAGAFAMRRTSQRGLHRQASRLSEASGGIVHIGGDDGSGVGSGSSNGDATEAVGRGMVAGPSRMRLSTGYEEDTALALARADMACDHGFWQTAAAAREGAYAVITGGEGGMAGLAGSHLQRAPSTGSSSSSGSWLERRGPQLLQGGGGPRLPFPYRSMTHDGSMMTADLLQAFDLGGPQAYNMCSQQQAPPSYVDFWRARHSDSGSYLANYSYQYSGSAAGGVALPPPLSNSCSTGDLVGYSCSSGGTYSAATAMAAACGRGMAGGLRGLSRTSSYAEAHEAWRARGQAGAGGHGPPGSTARASVWVPQPGHRTVSHSDSGAMFMGAASGALAPLRVPVTLVCQVCEQEWPLVVMTNHNEMCGALTQECLKGHSLDAKLTLMANWAETQVSSGVWTGLLCFT
jgi:hypothetical protein